MAERDNQLLFQAAYESKLKTYYFLYPLIVMVCTCFGIVVAVPWLLGWGFWWAGRYYASLSCALYEKTLSVKKGVLFKVEQDIPLDKIQDITLREGPLLKALGLCSLHVDTAGSSGNIPPQVGIVEAKAFRDRVLAQRDQMASSPDSAPASAAAQEGASQVELLTEIRDSLQRLEQNLGRRDEDT